MATTGDETSVMPARGALGLPSTYWYLWAGALINRLGGFVFTFLPLYLTQMRGFSVASAGAMVSLYGAGSLMAGPIGGALADRYGRRVTMLFSIGLAAAAMLQLGFARDGAHIAASTFLLGLFGDMYRPALNATVADVVPPTDRTRAYGYIYWAVNLGFAGASVIAGLLANTNFTLLFIGDAVTTVIFGAIVFWRVPETHPRLPAARPAEGAPPRATFAATLVMILEPYRDRTFALFVATQFVVNFVFLQGHVALPLDMRAHGVSPKIFGLLIALNGVLIVALQPAGIKLVQRVDRARAMMAGALLVGVGFGATGLASTPAGYGASIVIWTLGEICFSSVAPALVADLAPTAMRGRYQGAFQLSWGAAFLASPIVGSFVLGRYGSHALWGGAFALALGAVAAFGGLGARFKRATSGAL